MIIHNSIFVLLDVFPPFFNNYTWIFFFCFLCFYCYALKLYWTSLTTRNSCICDEFLPTTKDSMKIDEFLMILSISYLLFWKLFSSSKLSCWYILHTLVQKFRDQLIDNKIISNFILFLSKNLCTKYLFSYRPCDSQ